MGRELASFDGITYSYNEDGIRTSKTVNGKNIYYYVNGTQLFEQTVGNDYGLHFFYDRNGELTSFVCFTLIDEPIDDFYYYVKNAQGDITGITDCYGNLVAKYEYDPWGKVISVTGSNLEIANLNPFRYRGYYYDTETGLYYLQSRYYDPEVGRFINCDDVNYIGLTESEVSYNPFAYCENEQVNHSDPSGHFARWIYNKFNSFRSRIVAVGIQFECAVSGLGIGVGAGIEFLYFTHLKRWQAYGYFPKSLSVDKSDIKQIVNKATSQLKKPTNLFKNSISGSLSVCAVIVYSNKGKSFSTSGYKGKFCTYSFSIKNLKSFYSKGDGCSAVGAGGQISSSLLSLSYSYSESNYFFANEFLSYVQNYLKSCYKTIYNYATRNIINRR